MTALPVGKQVDDPASRIRSLLDSSESDLRTAFDDIIRQVRDQTTLATLADLIEQGRFQEALESAARAGAQFAAAVNGVYVVAGAATADVIRRQLRVVVSFDTLNARALRVQQANQFRLIQDFTVEQTLAVREALVEGVRTGANPVRQARAFRDTIGLTASQARAVANFRRLLEAGSSEALTRRLRDRRFDPTVRRAVREGVPLAPAQIDRMVDRYRERYVSFRSRVIARTEALRAVHQGTFDMYRQAFDQGLVDPSQVVRTWHTAADERVRGSHVAMNGQERPPGEPFFSGAGNRLDFPGDPEAPPSDTIQCRCVVSTRIL